MRGSRVSLCYYPTTVIFVDDQENFLKTLEAGLDDNVPSKFFTTPQELINFIKDYQSDHFINYCVTYDEDSVSENLIARQVSLGDIHRQIDNPDRFNQVSLLVADYAMPGANGLTCCRAVKDRFIQKLLLTGEAQNDLAVKAFNEHVINKFIQKSTPNLITVLNKAISELQLNYFLTLSDSLRGEIEIGNNQMLAVLDDPIFAQFFYDICKSNNIVEYYLLDNQGSFLMLDNNAKAYWLLIKNELEMRTLLEFARMEDAPQCVIIALSSRKSFPFFPKGDDISPLEWENYLHPATELKGIEQIYYYSLLIDAPFGNN